MDLVEELDDPRIPIVQACAALGISRATLYRQTQPARPVSVPVRRPSPRRLDDSERQVLLDTLHSEEFVDQPPTEVYATLLSRGVYLASIRTMYRVLASFGESAERRAQRGPMTHAKPTLTATAPNQVWTWDITKLRGPGHGVFYCLYVILDLFSRMTVGWLLAECESAVLAQQLFTEAVERHGVARDALTVHADRGSAMRSEALAQLFASLAVTRSFSRPHVSDDNAFSESQFKTLKYQPDYPERFTSLAHAQAWCQEFFAWYNDHHQHSGLALFTPAEVFFGRVEEVAARRQAALDQAYAQHPERFPNGPPIVRRPPVSVAINPLSIDHALGATTPAATTLPVTRPAGDATPTLPRPSLDREATTPSPSALVTTPVGGTMPPTPRPSKRSPRNASRDAIPS
jgi:putative transposase